MKQTKENIAAEIQWLKDNKPNIRRRTGSGDDNHAALDACIEVLNESLSEETVFNLYGNDFVRDSALQTARWMTGDDDMAPSHKDNWGGLVKRSE